MRNSIFPIATLAVIAGLSVASPAWAESPVAIAAQSSGEIDVVWQTPCGGLILFYAPDQYSSFREQLIRVCFPNGSATHGPAIAVRSDGEIDVVALGPDSTLMYYWGRSGGVWNSYMLAPSAFLEPAIAVHPTGEANVVFMGPQNSLMLTWAFPGTLWTTTQIGGNWSTYSAPAIAVRNTGEVDVVAEGLRNTLEYYWTTSDNYHFSHAVIAEANTTYSAPAIAVRNTGEADVVVQGPLNSLLYYSATPGSSWAQSVVAWSGTTYLDPAIAVRTSGEVDVVASGPNGQVIYYWATNPGPPNWSSAAIAPGVAPNIWVQSANPDGRANVVFMNSWYGSTPYLAQAMPGWPWGWFALP